MGKHKKGGYKKKKELEGLQVEVRNNNIEFALKKFKRLVKNSGLMLDIKKRTFYEKPSVTKREKHNLAKLRNKYNQQKEKKSN